MKRYGYDAAAGTDDAVGWLVRLEGAQREIGARKIECD